MKKRKITVTEAARNFADCVNRAHYQKISFVLVKNGKAMAQLTPVEEKVCFGRDAAIALAKVRLTPNEIKAWRRDLKSRAQIPETTYRQMAIMLDTDVIVESEKGKFDLSKWLVSFPGEKIEIAAITVAELRHGVERVSGSYRAKR